MGNATRTNWTPELIKQKVMEYTDRLDLLETASEFWTGLTGGVAT